MKQLFQKIWSKPSFTLTLFAALASATAPAIPAAAQDAENPEVIEYTTLNLESAGSLGVEALYVFDKLSDIRDLKVNGQLNSADWATIKQMTSIRNLDLSGVTNQTAIPNETFRYRSSLQSIQLPPALYSIGEYGLADTNIKEITIPESVYYLGSGTFYNCKSLEKFIHLGYGEIPSNCFHGNSSLTTVELSDNITKIGSYAFTECPLTEFKCPESLTYIDSYAFQRCRKMTDVEFNEGLTSIGSYAFAETGITKCILPLNAAVNYNSFAYCHSLEEIVLPAKQYYYYNDSSAPFFDCPKVKKLTSRTATPPDYCPLTYVPLENVTLCVPSFAVVDYKLSSQWNGFGTIEGTVTSDYWFLNSTLSLTNNRRMEGTPSVTMSETARLTVGGTAPFAINEFEIRANLYNNSYAQIINDSPAMTANSLALDMYIYSSQWYFVSFPFDVKLSNITHSAGGDFVFRNYDGETRAAGNSSNWKNLDNDAVLEAGKGYIVQSNREGDLNFVVERDAITAFLANGERSVEVKGWEAEFAANQGWNLIGNPYMSYFDMAATTLTCPITLWNQSSRNYQAYSLIDDNVVLRPFQAFYMQQTEGDGVVTFSPDGRQYTSEVVRDAYRPAIKALNSRRLYDIVLTGAAVSDRTRVVINEEASLGYESTCDASKFLSMEADAAALYTIDDNDNMLAINERPVDDGIVRLGLALLKAGNYTISADRAAGDLMLFDSLTGKYYNIANNESCTISADKPETFNNRFSLHFANQTTSVEAVTTAAEFAVEGNTLIVSGADGLDVMVCSLDGKVVAAQICGTDKIRIALNPGLYIVKCADKTEKIIIK